MKITTRLLIAFLMVSVAPLGLIGYAALQGMQNLSALAIAESSMALNELGEDIIRQRTACRTVRSAGDRQNLPPTCTGRSSAPE